MVVENVRGGRPFQGVETRRDRIAVPGEDVDLPACPVAFALAEADEGGTGAIHAMSVSAGRLGGPPRYGR